MIVRLIVVATLIAVASADFLNLDDIFKDLYPDYKVKTTEQKNEIHERNQNTTDKRKILFPPTVSFTDVTDYPHHVFIKTKNGSCTGIILSDKFILTSSICVNRTRIQSMLVGSKFNKVDSGGFSERVNFTRVLRDLALIRVRGHMKLSRFIRPVLFENYTMPLPDVKVETVGTRFYYIMKESATVMKKARAMNIFGNAIMDPNRVGIKGHGTYSWAMAPGNPVFFKGKFFGVIVEAKWKQGAALVARIDSYIPWMERSIGQKMPTKDNYKNDYKFGKH